MNFNNWEFDERGESYKWRYLDSHAYYDPLKRNKVIWRTGGGYRNNKYHDNNWHINIIFKL